MQQRRNQDTAARRPFADTNKWACHIGHFYVVYSYGSHWPMFIYDEIQRRWFENEDSRSVTTSKHRSQCHPHAAPMDPLSCGSYCITPYSSRFFSDAAGNGQCGRRNSESLS